MTAISYKQLGASIKVSGGLLNQKCLSGLPVRLDKTNDNQRRLTMKALKYGSGAWGDYFNDDP